MGLIGDLEQVRVFSVNDSSSSLLVSCWGFHVHNSFSSSSILDSQVHQICKLVQLHYIKRSLFRDVDDFCLKQNKWGGFKERLAEQRRIFASVREEHVEIVHRLDESREELEDLERRISFKSNRE